MVELFKKYIYDNEFGNALLVGQNIFYKNKGDKEVFSLYFDLLLYMAEKDASSAEKYLEQAVNILSLYSENVDIDENQVKYIRDCEIKLNAWISKLNESKEQERIKSLKALISQNDVLLNAIKGLISKLNSAPNKNGFEELLAEISAKDCELDKDNFVSRQKNEYDILTKQCQQIVDIKLKEFERQENVKYNQEALEAYERIFKVFKDAANSNYHANQIIELFSYDPSRLFNETLIYYNHVYNYILSKLSDEEKLSLTKLAIIAEKKR